jgi:uncharacterized membrane protein
MRGRIGVGSGRRPYAQGLACRWPAVGSGLVGMFVTALEERGREWPVVLAILVIGLGVAMAMHLATIPP